MLSKRSIPDRLRYLAQQLEESPVTGRTVPLAVAFSLKILADEMTEAIEVRHVQDEEDKDFQNALVDLAKRCSACEQPLPPEAA